MDVDPRTNVVVFQLNNSADELAIGRAPTVADDGVRQAWGRVLHDHGTAPESVVALHSEWEPTPTDLAFIEATFPDAAVTFNFHRPNPDGWEDAFTAAKALMVKAAAQTPDDGAPSTPTAAGPSTPTAKASPPTNVDGGGSVEGSESSTHEPKDTGHEPTNSGEPPTNQPTAAEQREPTNDSEPPTHQPTSTEQAPTHSDKPPTNQPTAAGQREPTNDSEPPTHQPTDAGQAPTHSDKPPTNQPAAAEQREPTNDSRSSTHQPTSTEQAPTDSGEPAIHQPVGAGRQESAGGGASAVRSGVDGEVGQDSGRGELLPVLWSAGSPRASLLEAVPHWPVAAGRLHLALAVVAPTPRGTIGMYHVTHHQLGGQSFNELMAEACENLAAGLRVNGHDTDDGQLLSLSGTLVAAAVCLPDFYRRLSEITNADRLVVGLPCPDEVYVAAADSPVAAVIHRAVHESEYPTTELVPSVLSIVGDDIEVLFERE